jgi:hypothetical protein
MAIRSPESRRVSSLLGDRRVSDLAMVGVLSSALVCGLIGFALHTLCVVAIIVLALGLGYVFANARGDRPRRHQSAGGCYTDRVIMGYLEGPAGALIARHFSDPLTPAWNTAVSHRPLCTSDVVHGTKPLPTTEGTTP